MSAKNLKGYCFHSDLIQVRDTFFLRRLPSSFLSLYYIENENTQLCFKLQFTSKLDSRQVCWRRFFEGRIYYQKSEII
jgi:hypothetical protein